MEFSVKKEDLKDNEVSVWVGKPKTKREKDTLAFRSFKIYVFNRILQVGSYSLGIQYLYKILRKHGLSENAPCDFSFQTKPHFVAIDWSPVAYNSQTVWYFDWNGTTCSITGKGQYNCTEICIRVHDLTTGIAAAVMTGIYEELLTYCKPTTPTTSLAIYTTVLTNAGFQWSQHSNRIKREMETIYLDSKLKDELVNGLQNFFNSAEIYDRYGVTWKRIYLFHGPPGTGKSSTVLALASKFNRNIAKFTMTPQLNAQHLERLFQSVPVNSFLLLEDVDALFTERKAESGVDFSTLLNCMDGITTQRGLVMFMTTNHVQKLDPALQRPGRVDVSVDFGIPSLDQYQAALNVLAADYKHEHKQFLSNCEMSIAALQKHLFDCIMLKKESILL